MEESQNSQRQAISPWSHGFALLKATKVKLIYLSLVGMAIPLFIAELIETQMSIENAEISRSWLNSPEAPEFSSYFAQLGSFVSSYVVLASFLFAVLFTSYISLVSICSQRLDETTPSNEVPLWKLWLTSLRYLPKGFLALLIIIGISASILYLSQTSITLYSITMSLLLFALSLCYAIPILIRRGFGPWQSIKSSIRMDYVVPERAGKWSVFFQVITFQVVAYLYINFGSFLIKQLLQVDQIMGFERSLVYSPDSWPFDAVYIAAIGFLSILSGLVIGGFAIFTTSFFHLLTTPNQPKEKLII